MNKAAIDVAQALARLSELTIFELRWEWRRLHRTPPPMRLSRDLLIRGITYKLQERAYGGLSMATARKLEQAAAGPPSRGAAKPTPPISLRPGTRLVREWHGVTHTALIHADGIEWHGQRYRSLSVVARKITGARWRGPGFFGLRQRPLDSTRVDLREQVAGMHGLPFGEVDADDLSLDLAAHDDRVIGNDGADAGQIDRHVVLGDHSGDDRHRR